MQFEFSSKRSAPVSEVDYLTVGSEQVRLVFVRHRRARRYVLRLKRDGVAQVTVPDRGSPEEGRRFAEGHTAWLAGQLEKQRTAPKALSEWRLGSVILLYGEAVQITGGDDGELGVVRVGTHTVRVGDTSGDLRRPIERHLLGVAEGEFPELVFELAYEHGFSVRQVSVRNQRTRWGSCSKRGTISLNWRLIQAPGSVLNYVILHELAHLRHMNHSARFWALVEELCPDYPEAELWLKRVGKTLKG